MLIGHGRRSEHILVYNALVWVPFALQPESVRIAPHLTTHGIGSLSPGSSCFASTHVPRRAARRTVAGWCPDMYELVWGERKKSVFGENTPSLFAFERFERLVFPTA